MQVLVLDLLKYLLANHYLLHLNYGPIIPFGKLYASVKISNTPG